SSVSLNFGSAAATIPVQVRIRSPTNALVDHPTIHLFATSGTDASTAGDVIVTVDIKRLRGLSVSVNPTVATFDGRYLYYTLEVKNSGNAREVAQVVITNPDDLAAVGWSATLGKVGGPLIGTTLTNVTVEANQTVTVRLRAQSSGGS